MEQVLKQQKEELRRQIELKSKNEAQRKSKMATHRMTRIALSRESSNQMMTMMKRSGESLKLGQNTQNSMVLELPRDSLQNKSKVALDLQHNNQNNVSVTMKVPNKDSQTQQK
jgi:hypothetical protein